MTSDILYICVLLILLRIFLKMKSPSIIGITEDLLYLFALGDLCSDFNLLQFKLAQSPPKHWTKLWTQNDKGCCVSVVGPPKPNLGRKKNRLWPPKGNNVDYMQLCL